MDRKGFTTRVLIAFGAQTMVLAAGFVSTLIVPKYLEVSEFGYFQLFLLYAAYSGLLHLGLNDGVYLLNGGRTRQSIDKTSITSQLLFALLLQMAIGAAIIALPLIFSGLDSERIFVIQMFGTYAIAYNITSFLGYVYQAVNETIAYSLLTATSRVVFIFAALGVIIVGSTDFKLLIIASVAGQYIALVLALIYGKNAFLTRSASLRVGFKDGFKSIRIGMWLLVANLANLLVLGAARFIIDLRWGIEAFGQLSLSFLIVSFVLVFVSQISMVLFPVLRRLPYEGTRLAFGQIKVLLGLAGPIVYLVYFPLSALVELWLPQYSEALSYLALLFPVAVLNLTMDVGFTTFFKVLRYERQLLVLNVCTLAGVLTAALISAFYFNSVGGVVTTVVISALLRLIIAEFLMSRSMETAIGIFPVWAVVSALVFVIASMSFDKLHAGVVYSLFLVIFLGVNRSLVASITKRPKRGGK